MKEATASVFASLADSQKLRLQAAQKIHDETQQELFVHHLLREAIAPKSVSLLPETTAWAMDLYKGLSLSDVQFVISGPRQSGKTSLLYELASVLFRKLQVSNESSQWLFFPVNFEIAGFHCRSPELLLRFFISVAFQSLEYSSLKLLPYLSALQKWFTLSSFGAALVPPQELTNTPLIKIGNLQTLSKSLSSSLSANKDNSLTDFVREIANFPHNFATALGLRGVIFVLDAFEYSNQEFDPSDTGFSASLHAVRFSDILSLALNQSPYLISLKDEAKFLQCFAGSSAALLTTEELIPTPKEPEIIVRNPSLTVRIEDCRGCPGFIIAYRKLLTKVRALTEKASYVSPYSSVSTTADQSRQKLVKQELVRFVGLLVDAGVDGYPRGVINDLNESLETTVRAGTAGQESPAATESFE
jgi:hypothetical protein